MAAGIDVATGACSVVFTALLVVAASEACWTSVAGVALAVIVVDVLGYVFVDVMFVHVAVASVVGCLCAVPAFTGFVAVMVSSFCAVAFIVVCFGRSVGAVDEAVIIVVADRLLGSGRVSLAIVN